MAHRQHRVDQDGRRRRPASTLKFSDAQQKQENQIKAMRSFIAQKVDVIAFSPVVETGWETVLREAKAAKIPVILTDRAVEVSDDSLYVTFIGSDFVEEGRKAGRWLLENTKDQTRATSTSSSCRARWARRRPIDRKKGFAEIINADPRFKIIRSQTGDFTRAKGKEVMEAFLKAEGKKINVLFAHNDDMAIGAIQAIEEAGMKPGKDIIIISIDGVKGAFEAMIAGKLNVTVECSPLLGPQLMARGQGRGGRQAAAQAHRHRGSGVPDGSRGAGIPEAQVLGSECGVNAASVRCSKRAGIGHAFSGEAALDGVDFALRAGEVHALMGQNGAGKSTLIKVLTGVEPPMHGEIALDGERDPARARRSRRSSWASARSTRR